MAEGNVRGPGSGVRSREPQKEERANRAYFSLGSNIDPEHNLPAAVRELGQYGRVDGVSRVWESPPFGSGGGPNFLNAGILLETELSAAELCLEAVPAVEARLGRVRDPSDKNAPRTIDVDLVLFNNDVLQIGRRQIPDPELLTRSFMAVPLAELDPDYVHPLNGRRLAEIAAQLVAMQPLQLRSDVTLGS
jgi:2-amino-4-hydroxy-6-hydroxymethyldihydropteridine diphosphokinase